MKELVFEELSPEQKIGLTLCADLRTDIQNNDLSFVLELVRNHSLGGIWAQTNVPGFQEAIRQVKEAADYPILVFCDSEGGYGETRIPQVISMTASGARDEYAYSFGRAVAALHQQMGFNVVCNPLLDICSANTPCGSTIRTFGSDKKTVARLGAAVARGMHDGGVLTVAKHYPGKAGKPYDSHMRENTCDYTEKELLEGNLYPYMELNRQGLLDGIMTGHVLTPKVDAQYPASLSRKVLDVLRKQGYRGFFITDALDMMGVVLKYGRDIPFGLAVNAGNMALGWAQPVSRDYEALMQCYREGVLEEAALDEVVRLTLEAQHRVTLLPKTNGPLAEDLENIRRINEECVCAVCDEGLTPEISREGRHLFAIMTYDHLQLNGEANITPHTNGWFYPEKVSERLKELFPNSDSATVFYSPTGIENYRFYQLQEKYDDLVFITHYNTQPFEGREHLSYHMVDLMDALQSTNRIIAHLHFGNPFVAADAPHMPRVLLGFSGEQCVMHTLDILHGDAPAVGRLPYDIQFHEKGYLFW